MSLWSSGPSSLCAARRLLAAAPLAAFMLLACAGAEEAEPPPPWRSQAALVGAEGDVLEVRVFDLQPVHSVESIRLIGPQGQTATPAETTEHKRITSGDTLARPRIGVGIQGGSSGRLRSGVGIAVPVFTKRETGGGVREGKEVVARIPIPKPAAYREAPEAWRIEIVVTDALGARRVQNLPAPRP